MTRGAAIPAGSAAERGPGLEEAALSPALVSLRDNKSDFPREGLGGEGALGAGRGGPGVAGRLREDSVSSLPPPPPGAVGGHRVACCQPCVGQKQPGPVFPGAWVRGGQWAGCSCRGSARQAGPSQAEIDSH